MLRFERYPNRGQRYEIEVYVRQGAPLGGFLEAVVSNDLKEACARADHINQPKLFDIVNWLHNEVPSWPVRCWGSLDAYRQWIEMGGLEGYERKCAAEVA